jgi:hypothetical protein
MQDKKSRRANVQAFGCASEAKELSSDYTRYPNKLLPKSHTDIRKSVSFLNEELERLTKNPPRGVSLAHINILRILYEKATRPLLENISYVKCPICKRMHSVVCPTCEKEHDIEVPSALMEKNSITALTKIADKFFPNLAAVTQNININLYIQRTSDSIIEIITRYVPAAERLKAVEDFRVKMAQVAETAEFEEVKDASLDRR